MNCYAKVLYFLTKTESILPSWRLVFRRYMLGDRTWVKPTTLVTVRQRLGLRSSKTPVDHVVVVLYCVGYKRNSHMLDPTVLLLIGKAVSAIQFGPSSTTGRTMQCSFLGDDLEARADTTLACIDASHVCARLNFLIVSLY